MNHPTTCPGSVFGEMACSVCEREIHNARNGAEERGMSEDLILKIVCVVCLTIVVVAAYINFPKD